MAAALPFIALGVAVLGKLGEANAQSSALNQQADVARYNADVSRDQAQQALAVSTAQQMQLRRQQRQEAGVRRAAAAQAAVGAGGSTAAVLERSEDIAELDALNIAYEGGLKARGYATQAELDEFQGRALQQQAKNVKRAGIFSAVGSGMTAYYGTGGRFGSTTTSAPRTTVAGGSGLVPGSGIGFRSTGGMGFRAG